MASGIVDALVRTYGPKQTKTIIKMSVIALIVLISVLTIAGRASFRSKATATGPIVARGISHTSKRAALDIGDEDECLPLEEYEGPEETYCEFVEENCNFATIPYVALYYQCVGNLSKAAVYLIMGALLLVWFYLMSRAAEEYFCPVLEIFTEKLNLSDDVAGVTFLALGNGVADVATTFEAVRGGGFNIAMGELLGAALFISSLVLSLVVLVGKTPNGEPVSVQKIPFIRDVSVLMITICGMLIIVNFGYISIYMAVLLLLGYLVYVLVVVVHHYYRHHKQKKRVSTIDDLVNDITEENASSDLLDPIEDIHRGDRKASQGNDEEDPFTFAGWWREVKELSLLRKIFYFATFPFNFVIALSTPGVKQWNRYSMLFIPVCGPMVTLFAFELLTVEVFPIGGKKVTAWMLCGIIGLIVGIALFMTSSWTEKPKYYNYVFLPLSFFFSMIWIYFSADELVAVLQTMGVVLDISSLILGATVLAWGNSLGDVVANVIMARHGAPKMALAACFAGPCFNILFGLGLSLTYSTVSAYPKPYDVTSTSGPIYFATVGFTLVCLAVSLVVISLFTKFTIPKPYAAFMFVLYAIYNVFVLLAVLGVLKQWGIHGHDEN